MTSKPRLLYWDACVFASYAGGIQGRIEILDSLVSMCPEKVRIITSTLSIAEASFASGNDEPQRSSDGEAKIDGLWDSSSIELVTTPPQVMYEARDYMRSILSNNGRSIKGADAIHLATCAWIHKNAGPVLAFHTYDKDLLRLDNIKGVPICIPQIIQGLQVPQFRQPPLEFPSDE